MQHKLWVVIVLPAALLFYTFYYYSSFVDYSDVDVVIDSSKSLKHVSKKTIEHDVDLIPQNVAEDQRKVIYLGTSFFMQPFKFDEMPQACRVSSDPADMKTADAIVFHVLDAGYPPPPDPVLLKEGKLGHHEMLNPNSETERIDKAIPARQVWIGVMYESAATYPSIRGYYNWTMSYRRDSDIYSPYCGKFTPVTSEPSLAVLEPRYETYRTGGWRKKKVAWMVSNCMVNNFRLEYALELSKYIEVDIYGGCSPNGLRCERLGADSCWDMISANYKFYLSFESANCKDYITEKFYTPMYFGVLPIVHGGSSSDDYAAIAPSHSYIDTRDFASPRELAEYLRKLDEDPALYEQFFLWRHHYNLRYNKSFVGQEEICRKLWHLEKYWKNTENESIHKWWRNGAVCVPPPYRPPMTWSRLLLLLATLGVCLFGLGYVAQMYLVRAGCLSEYRYRHRRMHYQFRLQM